MNTKKLIITISIVVVGSVGTYFLIKGIDKAIKRKKDKNKTEEEERQKFLEERAKEESGEKAKPKIKKVWTVGMITPSGDIPGIGKLNLVIPLQAVADYEIKEGDKIMITGNVPYANRYIVRGTTRGDNEGNKLDGNRMALGIALQGISPTKLMVNKDPNVLIKLYE